MMGYRYRMSGSTGIPENELTKFSFMYNAPKLLLAIGISISAEARILHSHLSSSGKSLYLLINIDQLIL
jgi:hypothetical protein